MNEESLLPQTCRRLLASYRRRVRVSLVSKALLVLSSLLLGFLLVEFILDFHLDIPVIVRGVLLLAGAGGFLRAAFVLLWRPLKRSPTEGSLAREIETLRPELQGRLVSAVQLSEKGNPAASHVSKELIGEIRREASEATKGLGAADLQPKRMLVLPGSVFLGFCAIWLLLAGFKGDVLGVWRSRLFLGSTAWPKEVLLEVLRPEGEKVVAGRGDDLVVEVKLRRGEVRRVELVCDWGGLSRVETMTGYGEKVFRYTISDLTKSFGFFVRGGDCRTSPVSVEVVPRPRIERISATVRYPEYAGVEEMNTSDGNVKALSGSRVSFRAWIRPPVKEAVFKLFASGKEEAESERELEINAGSGDYSGYSIVTGSFEVRFSGYYTFDLRGKSGFKSSGRSRYTVRMVPDQVPKVRIDSPRSKVECTSEGSVVVKGTVTDDWGLSESTFTYRIRGPEEEKPGQRQRVPLDLKGGEKKAGVEFPFELGKLALKEGSSVLWCVEATDAGGGTGTSVEQVIIIVSRGDLRDILFDKFAMLAEELRGLAGVQARSVRRMRKLKRDTAGQATLRKEDAAPALGRTRSEEQRVNVRLNELSEQFFRLNRRMVRNGVGDLKERRWMDSLGEEVKTLRVEKVVPLAAELRLFAEEVVSGNASPSKLPHFISRQESVENDLRDLVERMTQYGDVNQLMMQLRDIMGAQERVKALTEQLKGE